MSEFVISVPGETGLDDSALLDLETRKVPAPEGFRMRNGEPLRSRWSAFLAGVYRSGEIRLVEGDDESDVLTGTASALAAPSEVVYCATREFDEMIMKGRFTNARRAHEPEPFYPALEGAENLRWRNVRPVAKLAARGRSAPREADVESRDVPSYWEDGYDEIVMIHLLRDVVELILLAGNPDLRCRTWCASVLTDREFARNEIFGGEPEG